jgi:hypothetical protein
MLAPADRRLLLDVLAPPEGYALDHALGTTFTLDLLALLRVPLAATALPWSGREGAPVDNPFALLTALRRNAAKVSLYCHAGATTVPARHIPLLAFLEDAVLPVTPPRRGGVFHPKIWLLRFGPDDPDDPVAYRLVVLSRNLTFDRSWDTALALEGELRDRRRGYAPNRPLSDFVAALPGMARAARTKVSQAAEQRAALLADEVRRVEWSPPPGFHDVAFHAIGHDRRPRWPVGDVHRLLVISPFVEAGAITRLRERVPGELALVGRFDELMRLDAAALEALDEVEVFDDAAAVLDVDEPPVDDTSDVAADREHAPELSGLHAKVFVGKRGHRAVVWVGSANASQAAFERNVEFMVELEGSHGQHGIDQLRDALRESRLLIPFRPGEPAQSDEAAEALQRTLERVAHALAAGGLRARADPVADGQWRITLRSAAPVDLEGLRLDARPLADQILRRVDLDASPACSFAPTGLSSVTPFFALRLSGRTTAGARQLDVTVRLPVEGLPDGRMEAVTAELLSDRERLLRFILVLLSDGNDVDRMLGELSDLLSERRAGRAPGSSRAAIGLPLLEPMLRALHRSPERLEEIDRLLADIRTAGASTADLLPPELEALWSAVGKVRKTRQ